MSSNSESSMDFPTGNNPAKNENVNIVYTDPRMRIKSSKIDISNVPANITIKCNQSEYPNQHETS